MILYPRKTVLQRMAYHLQARLIILFYGVDLSTSSAELLIVLHSHSSVFPIRHLYTTIMPGTIVAPVKGTFYDPSFVVSFINLCRTTMYSTQHSLCFPPLTPTLLLLLLSSSVQTLVFPTIFNETPSRAIPTIVSPSRTQPID
jgi:hypothetical protein